LLIGRECGDCLGRSTSAIEEPVLGRVFDGDGSSGGARCWGLASLGDNAEDMLRKVTNGTSELKPVDVLRARRRSYVSSLVCDHERIGVALLRRRAEVERRAHTSTGEGVRDEVMLSKDAERAAEGVDDIVYGDFLGSIEDVEYIGCQATEYRAASEAGYVDKLRDCSDRGECSRRRAGIVLHANTQGDVLDYFPCGDSKSRLAGGQLGLHVLHVAARKLKERSC